MTRRIPSSFSIERPPLDEDLAVLYNDPLRASRGSGDLAILSAINTAADSLNWTENTRVLDQESGQVMTGEQYKQLCAGRTMDTYKRERGTVAQIGNRATRSAPRAAVARPTNNGTLVALFHSPNG